MKGKLAKRIPLLVLFAALLLQSACGLAETVENRVDQIRKPASTEAGAVALAAPAIASPDAAGVLETIQAAFRGVYTQTLPSVVNIRVIRSFEGIHFPDSQEFPFPSPFEFPDESRQFRRSGLGSGFVWDDEGHIVTNNHVVENADKITVTFYDGTSMEGKLIGADPDSDLAVIEVDYPTGRLQPVQLADSTQVEVGQLAAAVGNPFGLDGTMTVGIVSALGRSLPVGQRINIGSTYTIPDVIQTDAPINPGNSGGVLVDMEGELIGVPTAIESATGVNSGIGFVIPSVIVQKVVPVLIEQGKYEHPWIGISGTTLNSDIAEKMGLERDQRGVLVIDVLPDSPAESVGLIGSDRVVAIDEQEFRLGGDVIVKIDSQDVRDFEDLTAYLARHTESGQNVKLTLLRDGRQDKLDLTLSARPNEELEIAVEETERSGDAWLGIMGVTVFPEIAEAMDLSPDQTGILIQQVIEDSPADRAGLRGSYKSITTNGGQILVGGDIITGLDNQEIDGMADFNQAAKNYQPDDEAELQILRDGDTFDVDITFATQP